MSQRIEVEVGGTIYNGWYEVTRGVVTVSTAFGQKSTQAGGTPPDVLARMLLREIVTKELRLK